MPSKHLTAIFLAGITASTHSYAFERDHDAHEHGHAELMIIKENQHLEITLRSPAQNIVGFEHAAQSEADKATLKKAVKLLKQADQLILLAPEAQCALENVELESALLSDQDDTHPHHDKHDAHGHDDAHHDEHDAHGHDETHSEFEVAYQYVCQNLSVLSAIDLKIFALFPLTERIDAKLLGQGAAQLQSLSPEQARVKF